MLRRLAFVLCLLLLAGCSRSSDPDPPRSLERYLSALQGGDYAGAYARSTLPQQDPYPGFALSSEHYEAFYRAHPLRGYTVKKVTKIQQRALGETTNGPPVFVIDIDLRYDCCLQSESWHIEGDVGGLLELEAAPLLFKAPAGLRALTVDGVRTPVSASGTGSTRLYSITVMHGIHQVRLGSVVVEVLTRPLKHISGPAGIADGVVTLNV